MSRLFIQIRNHRQWCINQQSSPIIANIKIIIVHIIYYRLEWPAKQGCPLGSFAYSVPVPCSNINNMNYYNLDDYADYWLMHHRRWFPILMIDAPQSGYHLLYLFLTKYTKAVYTKLQCPQHTENLKMPTFSWYLRMMIVIADDGRWGIIADDWPMIVWHRTSDDGRRTDAEHHRYFWGPLRKRP